MATILVAEGSLAFARNRLWGNAEAMWRDSVSKSPLKLRPRFQLAYALYENGKCGEAAEEYQRAAQIEPPAYDLLLDWGLALDCAGNGQDAVAKLKQAALIEGTAHIYSQIGMVLAKNAQYSEALAALNQAASLDATFATTFIYRGTVHQLIGNLPRAAEDFRRVLSIDPSNRLALDELRKLSSQR